jgi:hypothetical protein
MFGRAVRSGNAWADCLEPIPPAADEQLLVVFENSVADPDVRAIRAFQIGQKPALAAVVQSPAQFRVSPGDHRVMRYQDLALRSANHILIAAKPQPLSVLKTVVQNA